MKIKNINRSMFLYWKHFYRRVVGFVVIGEGLQTSVLRLKTFVLQNVFYNVPNQST